MKPGLKLLSTSTFRLAATYLMVFLLSVGAILAYVYWNTAVLLERQIDDTIRAEIQGLAEQYRQRGLGGLVETIGERSRIESDSVYMFTNHVGRRLAGNIDGLPAAAAGDEPGFIEFPFAVEKGGRTRQHMARAFHTGLGGGFRLVVGRDVEERRRLGDLIRNALVWSVALALVFGVGGGLLMSRNFLHRIDKIAATSKTIMAGDLSGRMPVAGSGDELDRLSGSLNLMLDQIQRLMSGMQEISSNVAHDLRTPLTRLRANTEAALRGKSASDYRQALEQNLQEADQLLATFNALLSIARAEAGETGKGLVAIDVPEFLADIEELYAPSVEETGGRFKLEAPDGLRVRADRQLLAQAVGNLIDNALKYGASADGSVALDVTAGLDDDGVRISVADTGAGIPAADRERVKQRFVRLEESRTRPGNGLGLSLVASVMKLHGGELKFLDNNPGLEARLLFPAAI